MGLLLLYSQARVMLGRYSKQSVGVAILGIQVINRYSKHKQDLDKSKKISKTALAEHKMENCM